MNIFQNLHGVKKLRVDRVTDLGGTHTIALQFIATDHKGNEGALELNLFDLPLAQMMSLYNGFKDANTRWLELPREDFLEESNPVAVAAAKVLAEDSDHIGG